MYRPRGSAVHSQDSLLRSSNQRCSIRSSECRWSDGSSDRPDEICGLSAQEIWPKRPSRPHSGKSSYPTLPACLCAQRHSSLPLYRLYSLQRQSVNLLCHWYQRNKWGSTPTPTPTPSGKQQPPGHSVTN